MIHRLYYRHSIPGSLDECWRFFSSPRNLRRLTPDYLDFQLTSDNADVPIYPGQIITYTIRPLLNLKIEWVTEITAVEKPHYFIDEQRFGPYAFWHHQHRFLATSQGVEMVDTVHYQLPYGIFGRLVNGKVQSDLKKIFSYRRLQMEKIFGACEELP